MNYQRAFCPECDSSNTEKVHVEWMVDAVEETRICNECPTQYRVAFSLSHKEVDEV